MFAKLLAVIQQLANLASGLGVSLIVLIQAVGVVLAKALPLPDFTVEADVRTWLRGIAGALSEAGETTGSSVLTQLGTYLSAAVENDAIWAMLWAALQFILVNPDADAETIQAAMPWVPAPDAYGAAPCAIGWSKWAEIAMQIAKILAVLIPLFTDEDTTDGT